MDYITTASGKQVNVSTVSSIPNPQMLYIRAVGLSIAQAAAIFGDPVETQKITYGNVLFTGYHLDALVNEGTMIRVNLRRG